MFCLKREKCNYYYNEDYKKRNKICFKKYHYLHNKYYKRRIKNYLNIKILYI